jgi:hypothetical protein
LTEVEDYNNSATIVWLFHLPDIFDRSLILAPSSFKHYPTICTRSRFCRVRPHVPAASLSMAVSLVLFAQVIPPEYIAFVIAQIRLLGNKSLVIW